MPRLNVEITASQDSLLKELSGPYSKADTIRKLIDLAALIKDETAQGMTFAMVDADGVPHRLLGIDMVLQSVDVTPSPLDEKDF